MTIPGLVAGSLFENHSLGRNDDLRPLTAAGPAAGPATSRGRDRKMQYLFKRWRTNRLSMESMNYG